MIKESTVDINAKAHIKSIKDVILKDYISENIKSKKNQWSLNKDVKLKDCYDILEKNLSQKDTDKISPFYLTHHGRPFKNQYHPTGFPKMNFGNRGEKLYLNFAKKLRDEVTTTRNKNVALNCKLSSIYSKYDSLTKNANAIEKNSKKKCKVFKRNWSKCESILNALKKDQDNFLDPDTNFNFYVWKVSKQYEEKNDAEEDKP